MKRKDFIAEFTGARILKPYHQPRLLYCYFYTDNTPYNKELQEIIYLMGYIRSGLYKSDYLLECSLGFEYTYCGIYIQKEKLEYDEAEKTRWENIRKGVLSNI